MAKRAAAKRSVVKLETATVPETVPNKETKKAVREFLTVAMKEYLPQCVVCGAPATTAICDKENGMVIGVVCDCCKKDYRDEFKLRDMPHADQLRNLIEVSGLDFFYRQHRYAVLCVPQHSGVMFVCPECESVSESAGDGCNDCGYGYREDGE